jgi:hypothetical protein
VLPIGCRLLPLQAYRKRRMNVMGPAVSPTVANGIVTQLLLAQAK